MTLPAVVPADEPELLIAHFVLHNRSEYQIVLNQDGEYHREVLIHVLDDSLFRVPAGFSASFYMRPGWNDSYDTSSSIHPRHIEPGQKLSWEKDVSKCYTLSEGGYLVRAYVDIFSYEAPQPFSRTISSNAVGLDITPASNKSVQQIRLE